MPFTAATGLAPRPFAYPKYPALHHLTGLVAPTVGAPVAVVVACVYGLPAHAVVVMFVMAYATGFGVTIGFHRLFAHRSFTTSRPVEWVLMILGCAAGQSSPFFWIATHRLHHRHSDTDDDPHSPHTAGGRPLGRWRGFWHAHFGWLRTLGFGYPVDAVRDLARRADLAWIDRHWLLWYVAGLLVPALAGYWIGGTAYDALIGFLWGGLVRHFLTIQATFCVNSVNHLWGTRPYATADHSRNNLLTGILAFGEGWHNNHHAFPWSARHGLRWWQPDFSWWVLWLMERIGLVWRVRRPDLSRRVASARESSVGQACSLSASTRQAASLSRWNVLFSVFCFQSPRGLSTSLVRTHREAARPHDRGNLRHAMQKTLPAIIVLVACVAWHTNASNTPRAAEPTSVSAEEPSAAKLEQQFRDTVQPFITSYCAGCHGSEKPRGDLDLSAYTTIDSIAKDYRRWQTVLEQLKSEAMPPEKAKQHPKAELRREVIGWIESLMRYEAKRTAGDPGHIPPRRLSNAEYDYTIRDLTGVDIRPTKEFPVDPANEAGFDNSAESLTMSPALLKKYLEAARLVADHLVLKPDGFTFAPHAVVTDTDRDKYCVNRIIDFYKRQRTDYADYFLAAWRFHHRAAFGRPNATLAEIATEAGLSAKYLATIWTVLTDAPEELGPIAALQAMWKELPAPDAKQPDAPRAQCETMRDFIVQLRQKLVPEVKNLTAPGVHNGSQTMVLWKNRQFVANRMKYSGGALQLKDSGLPRDTAAARAMAVPTDKAAAEKYEATFNRFCATFPDAFYVSERARVYLDPEKEKKLGGRLLSAGFHSMTGYFRDDGPLYELMLDQQGQRELDRLWREFDFITTAPLRQYTSFVWFERTDSSYMRDPEFDFARAEDKDVTSEAKIKKLAEVYAAKTRRRGASEVALEAIKVYFETISAQIRWVETTRLAAEPTHVKALQDLAERAYRRPLSKAERDGVAAFYRTLRDREKLTHEESVRDALVSILMSPHFCYRVDRPVPGAKVVNGTQPLSDYALASRLSYFLWSSLPDAELLAHAAAGNLHKPEVLTTQVRRMLRDPKVRGLATEFGGNWLDFRRFEEHNSVDRERFKQFDNELRQAMFEEPVRFFIDLAREDRSVLDFLYAKHTFVNAALARHYGMPDVIAAPRPVTGRSGAMPDEWVRIDDADKYGRGGLLPMAVFMTKNAPGLRTSPVKRGYWVVRRLLGEHIPAPPAEVPELPADEAKLGERTLREVLAKHREHKSCAGCHDRFDGIGVAFEGFGPIGELRTKDLGGRAVETRATFPGGVEGTGIDGLRAYLRDRRQEEFIDNLCRKMLAYALGRSLTLADEETVREMRVKLKADGYRFSTLIECIVTSPQFLNKQMTADPERGKKP